MNEGQEKFSNFIMLNVEEKNQDKSKELLTESFKKQNDGTFNKEYLITFIPRMLELIKPECVEQVKNIIINYKA
ncbi:hypothetical protein [Clostridium septicum]|uniref:Uncharacterized protein n=1 Tax=Clostridium septicum TaxID=1504 RepID=A0A9N7JPH4_CLOSE|nr:hypothetical protein [Clostridium septicum]AYE35437.1 hypothetical protein CP523_13930 [Clostridium septicum]MDU1314892.1 hypothetical protein [Clostridium septicum]QAS60824.1 hypothetical protein EI377_08820 [Clostridium septicum]UEC19907.1 hypothetical protein LK444_10835 [Clostridium septicum]USS02033.1 hypothetical protein NH397_06330 [Clostridium septicum]